MHGRLGTGKDKPPYASVNMNIFAKNEKELESQTQTTRFYSQDM